MDGEKQKVEVCVGRCGRRRYFLPYRKVRRQMDMESEGELVRYFIENNRRLYVCNTSRRMLG